MTYSSEGLALTKYFEGCRLEAYQDSGGVWTIGWGHTAGVKEGDTCTQEQADAWLAEDVEISAAYVNAHVTAPLTQWQFDALVDFVYNLGPAAFYASTLLRRLNKFMYTAAANEFPRWNKAGGKVSPGLTRRRLAEQAMFEGRDWR